MLLNAEKWCKSSCRALDLQWRDGFGAHPLQCRTNRTEHVDNLLYVLAISAAYPFVGQGIRVVHHTVEIFQLCHNHLHKFKSVLDHVCSSNQEQIGVCLEVAQIPTILPEALVQLKLSKETVDSIAVLVTGGGAEMLLCVLKTGHGTGKHQAETCLATLDECDIRQQVRDLVFDTTASNTGLKNGACTFIEQSRRWQLAWVLPHVMELVRASVFRALFGPTGGPDVAMFKRFQQGWPYVGHLT